MDARQTELVDYLGVLWRRRWLLALGSLAGVLVAALITWQLPRVYQLRAMIDPGDPGDEQVKEIELLLARVSTGGALEGATRFQPGSPPITVEFKKPVLITLGVEGSSPAEAREILDRVAAQLVERVNRLVTAQRARVEARLEVVQQQIDTTRQEIAALRAQLHREVDRHLAATRARLETRATERALLLLQLRAGVSDMADKTRVRIWEVETALAHAPAERADLERRLKEARTNLDGLYDFRRRGFPIGEDQTSVLAVAQLSSQILAHEALIAELDRDLRVTWPARVRAHEAERWALAERLGVLDRALTDLRGTSRAVMPAEIVRTEEAVYRTTAPDSHDVRWLAQLVQRLGRNVSVAVRDLDLERERLEDQRKALDEAAALLRSRTGEPPAWEQLRAVTSRVVVLEGRPVDFLESAVRRLETELPTKHRGLHREAEELARRVEGIRPARLVAPLETPGVPIRPRVRLNLALGLAAGVMGSVVLAFLAEYVASLGRRTLGEKAGVADA